MLFTRMGPSIAETSSLARGAREAQTPLARYEMQAAQPDLPNSEVTSSLLLLNSGLPAIPSCHGLGSYASAMKCSVLLSSDGLCTVECGKTFMDRIRETRDFQDDRCGDH